MNDDFKILIAYDGSNTAEAALDDLKKAGLPEKNVEALILSVAEVWLPPQDQENDREREFITEGVRKKYEENLKFFDEAKQLTKDAAERVRAIFPDWKVETRATYGSPAWEILVAADNFNSDLIVVGATGCSAVERVLLGSTSQKVVTEANCTVRISRGKIEVDESPARIIIGYDGSAGSVETIRAVARKHWKKNTQFKIVIVEDTVFVRSSLEIETDEIKKVGAEIRGKLESRGLETSLVITEGNPKYVLIEEAEQWDADCIFIGATRYHDVFTKYLLGSVTSAIVTRADCSVEVVRPRRTDIVDDK